MQSTEKIIPQPEVAIDTPENERGQLGAAAQQLGGVGAGTARRESVWGSAEAGRGPARLGWVGWAHPKGCDSLLRI